MDLRIRKLLFLFCIGALLCACQPKDKPVRHLEELTEELILNGDQYTLVQWRDAIIKYAQIEKELAHYADEYNSDERRMIARLEKLCEDQLYRGAGYSVGETINELGVRVGQFMDGLNESLDGKLDGILK